MKKVFLYTDGSALQNPGNGGWGAILKYGDHELELSGSADLTTNNRMELLAVIKGLERLKEPCDVTVVSDSMYVISAISKWLKRWVKQDFNNKANMDLWKQYLEVSKPHKIKTKWVRGHNGHKYNERCDRLAGEAAKNKY